ncbi:hypothetical protein WJX81_004087 [Elliptochloris bilobata]|uniref:Uncharacterized protein n=1 Tax=Elliptochloris bilobata TaxID=381761 RepID=A0AAW1S0Q8_9CHLO
MERGTCTSTAQAHECCARAARNDLLARAQRGGAPPPTRHLLSTNAHGHRVLLGADVVEIDGVKLHDTLGAKAGAFTEATTLFLAGVDASVLWSIESVKGRRTGRFATSDFVGSTYNDARGDWMSLPQAVLHATREGSKRTSTWALQLSQPRFHASNTTLSFSVKVLHDISDARYPGGAVAYALADGDHSLVTEVAPGSLLKDPVLFIDDSTTSQETASEAAVALSDDNAGGAKASFLPLTGAYKPSDFGTTDGSGALVQQTQVSTSLSTRGGSGGGGAGSGGLIGGSGGLGGGLINAGSGTSNSASVYMRASWCPDLGWVYKSDPYACGGTWGK